VLEKKEPDLKEYPEGMEYGFANPKVIKNI